MTTHEMRYQMGAIRMPHLVTPVLPVPNFYCTCGAWYHLRDNNSITPKYLAVVSRRHAKHVKESS
jgi:hypothetical protein